MLSVDMLTYQQEVESRMEMRVQDLLDKTMGKDNGMVRISATLDFAKVEKTEELFDGDDPVIRSEQVNEEGSALQSPGGIPGVASNLQTNEFGEEAVSSPLSRNSRTTNYEISKTVSRIINPVGTLTKLSVSVLVADKVVAGEDQGKPVSVARSPEELKAIENMVSTAIGLVPDRGDIINVTSMPFVDPGDVAVIEQQPVTDLLYHYMPLVKYMLIGLGMLLIYFLLVRPVIKTMKGEIQQHYKTVKQLEQEQREAIELEALAPPLPIDDAITSLRREVLQNQVPTAYILKNWIQEG